MPGCHLGIPAARLGGLCEFSLIWRIALNRKMTANDPPGPVCRAVVTHLRRLVCV